MRSPPLLSEFFPGAASHVVCRGGGLHKYHSAAADAVHRAAGLSRSAPEARRKKLQENLSSQGVYSPYTIVPQVEKPMPVGGNSKLSTSGA
jgi:hypothetical protein